MMIFGNLYMRANFHRTKKTKICTELTNFFGRKLKGYVCSCHVNILKFSSSECWYPAMCTRDAVQDTVEHRVRTGRIRTIDGDKSDVYIITWIRSNAQP
jgi:hypothetical protein